ncbi:response regulator [Terriglobus aquaticus]|uniref:Response regulator n=1 Tax=Terriglobus aquaticus TaxID=940139 RepID=A0ABW9KRN6_9BACT|nr:response regulator [Terriglobus aquaticus]
METCRVLVIEDELLVGLDLVFTLQGAGFRQVEHAMNEPEALDRLHSETWDAVVADANLNGRGIHRIAELLQKKRLPFLVVTGYARENLPAVIGEAPVLTKPFSHREVVRSVQQLCGCLPNLLSSPTTA